MEAPKTVRERIQDGMREVGTLLITFAPLDVALADRAQVKFLLLFLLLGICLFAVAVVLERRGSHER